MRLICTISLLAMPFAAHAQEVPQGERNTSLIPAFEDQTRAPQQTTVAVTAETFAIGLDHPWGLAALPNGGYLVTERPGRLRMVSAAGQVGDPIGNVPEVLAENQGGLLDVAVSDDFAQSRVIYLTYSKPLGGGASATAAARAILSDDGSILAEVSDIWVQTPPSPTPMHYGSRAVPMPDGSIVITTGEHSSMAERVLAQDVTTGYGKVIRIMPDGSPFAGNPFLGGDGLDTIWSYGHRNIQGAALDANGTLWTIEHGPKGGDELNAPQPGLNYGWPVISYGETYTGDPIGSGAAQQDGMEQPVYFWDPVIAPGDMMFHSGTGVADWAGDAFIGSLYPGGVVRLELSDGRVVAEERLLENIGRVRDVHEAPDGSLLLLIDAEAGSIVRLVPAQGG